MFNTPPLKADEKNVQHALSTLQAKSVDISQWLPDSGSSSHVIGNLNFFDTYTSYTYSNIVLIGNGKHLHIQHIGTVTLHTTFGLLILHNYLRVPFL